MSIPGYQVYLVEALTPKLYKDSEGEVTLRVLYLNGLPANLSIFDEIKITMKNHPEKDETITFECTIDSEEDGLCSFPFTVTDSEAWLVAPYHAQLQFTIYDRDDTIVTSATGFVPAVQDLYIKEVTSNFSEDEVITGALSGFTARVRVAEAYDYNAQKVTLCLISGVPTDGESLSGSLGGIGKVYGPLGDAVSLSLAFGDSVEDLSSVRANDVLSTDSTPYIVEGFDPIVDEWIVPTTSLHVSGSGLSYTIKSYDPATSGISRMFLSELFPMQVLASL